MGGGIVALADMKTLYFAVDKELEREIEEYRRSLPEIPNRSEAIRQLVKLGLESRK